MIRCYNPFLCLIFLPFPRHYQATVAIRQTETEAESLARHTRNSQGLYVLDVFKQIFKYQLNLSNINQVALLVARMKQKLSLKLDMLGTVRFCIRLMYSHVFFNFYLNLI